MNRKRKEQNMGMEYATIGDDGSIASIQFDKSTQYELRYATLHENGPAIPSNDSAALAQRLEDNDIANEYIQLERLAFDDLKQLTLTQHGAFILSILYLRFCSNYKCCGRPYTFNICCLPRQNV